MNDTFTIKLGSEAETAHLAEAFATKLPAPFVMTFEGEIGAGKTTFIRAMLKKMGVKTSIKSPTFSLVESYDLVEKVVHHFDFYRIHAEDELEYIGIRDYFSSRAICCVEWPEKGRRFLTDIDMACIIKPEDTERELTFRAGSQKGKQILSELLGHI